MSASGYITYVLGFGTLVLVPLPWYPGRGTSILVTQSCPTLAKDPLLVCHAMTFKAC